MTDEFALTPYVPPTCKDCGKRIGNRSRSRQCAACRQKLKFSLLTLEERKLVNKQYLVNRAKRCSTPEGKIKFLLDAAKVRSRKWGRPHTIQLSDLLPLPTHCPILGIKLDYSKNKAHSRNSASVDRIDSRLGYLKGNVRVISDRANRLRSDATAAELRAIAEDAERIESVRLLKTS